METLLARIDVRLPAHWDKEAIDAYLEAAFGRFGEGVIAVELNPLVIVGFGGDTSDELRTLLSMRIEHLGLIGRAFNALHAPLLRPRTFDAGTRSYSINKDLQISTIGELVSKTARELMDYTGFGKYCLMDVRRRLADHGLALQGETPPSES